MSDHCFSSSEINLDPCVIGSNTHLQLNMESSAFSDGRAIWKNWMSSAQLPPLQTTMRIPSCSLPAFDSSTGFPFPPSRSNMGISYQTYYPPCLSSMETLHSTPVLHSPNPWRCNPYGVMSDLGLVSPSLVDSGTISSWHHNYPSPQSEYLAEHCQTTEAISSNLPSKLTDWYRISKTSRDVRFLNDIKQTSSGSLNNFREASDRASRQKTGTILVEPLHNLKQPSSGMLPSCESLCNGSQSYSNECDLGNHTGLAQQSGPLKKLNSEFLSTSRHELTDHQLNMSGRGSLDDSKRAGMCMADCSLKPGKFTTKGSGKPSDTFWHGEEWSQLTHSEQSLLLHKINSSPPVHSDVIYQKLHHEGKKTSVPFFASSEEELHHKDKSSELMFELGEKLCHERKKISEPIFSLEKGLYHEEKNTSVPIVSTEEELHPEENSSVTMFALEEKLQHEQKFSSRPTLALVEESLDREVEFSRNTFVMEDLNGVNQTQEDTVLQNSSEEKDNTSLLVCEEIVLVSHDEDEITPNSCNYLSLKVPCVSSDESLLASSQSKSVKSSVVETVIEDASKTISIHIVNEDSAPLKPQTTEKNELEEVLAEKTTLIKVFEGEREASNAEVLFLNHAENEMIETKTLLSPEISLQQFSFLDAHNLENTVNGVKSPDENGTSSMYRYDIEQNKQVSELSSALQKHQGDINKCRNLTSLSETTTVAVTQPYTEADATNMTRSQTVRADSPAETGRVCALSNLTSSVVVDSDSDESDCIVLEEPPAKLPTRNSVPKQVIFLKGGFPDSRQIKLSRSASDSSSQSFTASCSRNVASDYRRFAQDHVISPVKPHQSFGNLHSPKSEHLVSGKTQRGYMPCRPSGISSQTQFRTMHHQPGMNFLPKSKFTLDGSVPITPMQQMVRNSTSCDLQNMTAVDFFPRLPLVVASGRCPPSVIARQCLIKSPSGNFVSCLVDEHGSNKRMVSIVQQQGRPITSSDSMTVDMNQIPRHFPDSPVSNRMPFCAANCAKNSSSQPEGCLDCCSPQVTFRQAMTSNTLLIQDRLTDSSGLLLDDAKRTVTKRNNLNASVPFIKDRRSSIPCSHTPSQFTGLPSRDHEIPPYLESNAYAASLMRSSSSASLSNLCLDKFRYEGSHVQHHLAQPRTNIPWRTVMPATVSGVNALGMHSAMPTSRSCQMKQLQLADFMATMRAKPWVIDLTEEDSDDDDEVDEKSMTCEVIFSRIRRRSPDRYKFEMRRLIVRRPSLADGTCCLTQRFLYGRQTTKVNNSLDFYRSFVRQLLQQYRFNTAGLPVRIIPEYAAMMVPMKNTVTGLEVVAVEPLSGIVRVSAVDSELGSNSDQRVCKSARRGSSENNSPRQRVNRKKRPFKDEEGDEYVDQCIIDDSSYPNVSKDHLTPKRVCSRSAEVVDEANDGTRRFRLRNREWTRMKMIQSGMCVQNTKRKFEEIAREEELANDMVNENLTGKRLKSSRLAQRKVAQLHLKKLTVDDIQQIKTSLKREKIDPQLAIICDVDEGYVDEQGIADSCTSNTYEPVEIPAGSSSLKVNADNPSFVQDEPNGDELSTTKNELNINQLRLRGISDEPNNDEVSDSENEPNEYDSNVTEDELNSDALIIHVDDASKFERSSICTELNDDEPNKNEQGVEFDRKGEYASLPESEQSSANLFLPEIQSQRGEEIFCDDALGSDSLFSSVSSVDTVDYCSDHQDASHVSPVLDVKFACFEKHEDCERIEEAPVIYSDVFTNGILCNVSGESVDSQSSLSVPPSDDSAVSELRLETEPSPVWNILQPVSDAPFRIVITRAKKADESADKSTSNAGSPTSASLVSLLNETVCANKGVEVAPATPGSDSAKTGSPKCRVLRSGSVIPTSTCLGSVVNETVRAIEGVEVTSATPGSDTAKTGSPKCRVLRSGSVIPTSACLASVVNETVRAIEGVEVTPATPCSDPAKTGSPKCRVLRSGSVTPTSACLASVVNETVRAIEGVEVTPATPGSDPAKKGSRKCRALRSDSVIPISACLASVVNETVPAIEGVEVTPATPGSVPAKTGSPKHRVLRSGSVIPTSACLTSVVNKTVRIKEGVDVSHATSGSFPAKTDIPKRGVLCSKTGGTVRHVQTTLSSWLSSTSTNKVALGEKVQGLNRETKSLKCLGSTFKTCAKKTKDHKTVQFTDHHQISKGEVLKAQLVQGTMNFVKKKTLAFTSSNVLKKNVSTNISPDNMSAACVSPDCSDDLGSVATAPDEVVSPSESSVYCIGDCSPAADQSMLTTHDCTVYELPEDTRQSATQSFENRTVESLNENDQRWHNKVGSASSTQYMGTQVYVHEETLNYGQKTTNYESVDASEANCQTRGPVIKSLDKRTGCLATTAENKHCFLELENADQKITTTFSSQHKHCSIEHENADQSYTTTTSTAQKHFSMERENADQTTSSTQNEQYSMEFENADQAHTKTFSSECLPTNNYPLLEPTRFNDCIETITDLEWSSAGFLPNASSSDFFGRLPHGGSILSELSSTSDANAFRMCSSSSVYPQMCRSLIAGFECGSCVECCELKVKINNNVEQSSEFASLCWTTAGGFPSSVEAHDPLAVGVARVDAELSPLEMTLLDCTVRESEKFDQSTDAELGSWVAVALSFQ